MTNRNAFSWNSMYNRIFQIKDKYERITQKRITDVPFSEVCEVVKDTFISRGVRFTEFTTNQYSLLLMKYSLHDGIDDIYKNKNSILREARSLVVDLISEEIVLCPFKKFFNLNEVEDMSIERVLQMLKQPHMIEITDKLDGSMQSIRWWRGQFIQAGSSALDANNSYQLKEGKLLLEKNTNLQELIKTYPDHTFIVEAILEDDRHIVNYQGNDLYLIGMRNVYTGEEASYEEVRRLAQQYQIKTTAVEDKSFKELLRTKSEYEACEKEGWVIRITNDTESIRFKLKCDEYVKMHGLLDETQLPNTVIRGIVDETIDDMIAGLNGKIREHVIQVRDEILRIMRQREIKICQLYDSLKNIPGDSDFAKAVNKFVPKYLRQFMFNKRKGIKYNLLKTIPTQDTSACLKYSKFIKVAV